MKIVNKVNRLFLVLIPILLLTSCAGVVSKRQQLLREQIKDGKYSEGLKTVDDMSPVKEEKSRLLFYLEKGKLFHLQGHYYLSSLYLERANEIAKELFTKSISKKLASGIVNDTVDVYYGSTYERSLIYFYLTLDYFMLYQEKKILPYTAIMEDPSLEGSKEVLNKLTPLRELTSTEAIQYLAKARATLLAWDSGLSAWKEERRGESVFKNDLLAKILGGIVHENFRDPKEDQIALLLYKEAKDLLLKNYNAYKSFNEKFKEFKKDYSKLPNLPLEIVERDYVSPTIFQTELKNLLDQKIAKQTHKGQDKNYPVSFFLQGGLIPEKRGEKVVIGFETVLNNIEDPSTRRNVQKVGGLVLAAFAANILGLTPPAGSGHSPAGDVAGIKVAEVAVNYAAISFELPVIDGKEATKLTTLEIFNKKSGELVKSIPLVLTNPIGEMAKEAVLEDSVSRYTRTGVRVGLKHLTAIMAAYLTYSGLKNKNDFIAKSAALLEYTALSKGIGATETADLRYWSSLPQEIRYGETALSPNEYEAKLKIEPKSNIRSENSRYINLGFFTVKENTYPQLVNYHLRNLSF